MQMALARTLRDDDWQAGWLAFTPFVYIFVYTQLEEDVLNVIPVLHM